MFGLLTSTVLTQQGFYLYNVISYFECPVPPKSQVTEVEKATLVSLFWIQFIGEISFLLVLALTFGCCVNDLVRNRRNRRRRN